MVRMRASQVERDQQREKETIDYQVFDFIVRIEQYNNKQYEFMTKNFPHR